MFFNYRGRLGYSSPPFTISKSNEILRPVPYHSYVQSTAIIDTFIISVVIFVTVIFCSYIHVKLKACVASLCS